MNEDPRRTERMVGAVDPARDLSDASIDELFPVERLEARIELATAGQPDRPSSPRRLQYAVAASVIVGAVVLLGVLAPTGGTAHVDSALVHVRGTRVATPSANGPIALSLLRNVDFATIGSSKPQGLLLGGPAVPNRWCDPSQLVGSLVGDRPRSRAAGWSGRVRIVNVGSPCAIATTTAAAQAISPAGHAIGPAGPTGRVATTALTVTTGAAADVAMAFVSPRTYPAGVCHARIASGLVLLGGSDGWPTLRFDLGHASFGVCTGHVSNFVSGVLTVEQRP